jgi:hypothetical protein
VTIIKRSVSVDFFRNPALLFSRDALHRGSKSALICKKDPPIRLTA